MQVSTSTPYPHNRLNMGMVEAIWFFQKQDQNSAKLGMKGCNLLR